jgi:hypothetical protein
MSSNDRPNAMTESSLTIPSDSEQYSGNDELSISPPSSSSPPPMILYSPPSLWGLLRGAAINLLLPFINGLMLGFGELFAHEAAFRLGWGGTKVITLLTVILKSSLATPGIMYFFLYSKGNLGGVFSYHSLRASSCKYKMLTCHQLGLPIFTKVASSRSRD